MAVVLWSRLLSRPGSHINKQPLIVNFMSQSSNSICLLIIFNGWVKWKIQNNYSCELQLNTLKLNFLLKKYSCVVTEISRALLASTHLVFLCWGYAIKQISYASFLLLFNIETIRNP